MTGAQQSTTPHYDYSRLIFLRQRCVFSLPCPYLIDLNSTPTPHRGQYFPVPRETVRIGLARSLVNKYLYLNVPLSMPVMQLTCLCPAPSSFCSIELVAELPNFKTHEFIVSWSACTAECNSCLKPLIFLLIFGLQTQVFLL